MASMAGKTDGGPLVAFPAIYHGVAQKISNLSATAQQSSPLQTDTTVVRLASDVDVLIDIGPNASASGGHGTYLPAKWPEYFACNGGDKISAKQITATGGNLYILEGAATLSEITT